MDGLGLAIWLFIIFAVAPYIVAFVCLIITLFKDFIGSDTHSGTSNAVDHHHRNHHQEGFFSHSERHEPSSYDPHDNHWESSFNWKDEDNDGYDDREDGFWNEREV